jgi:L-ascorbate metabolism protein UlaG (beta-lactamase superfamily)
MRMAMQITKYGHSCMLVESGGARVLIDPGTYSSGFEGLRELDGLLLTHQHVDHFDRDRVLDLLAGNRSADIVADEQTAVELADASEAVRAAHEGDRFQVAGLDVTVHGREHAVIYPELPPVANVGYFVGGVLFHPGDALTVPDREVVVLAVPVGAPWLTVREGIDYVRRVRPRIAVAVHERALAAPQMAYSLFERFATEHGTRFAVLEGGESLTV